LIFTLLASIVSTLIFGLAPAVQASRIDLNEALKVSGRGMAGGPGTFHARALLVTLQMALSLVLVVGASLMIETLARLESHPLGFHAEDVSVGDVAIPKERWNDLPARRLLFNRLLEKLKALPGIQEAAISGATPIGGGFEDRFSIEGQPERSEDAAPKTGHQPVTQGYFEALRIPLLAGRSFNEQDDDKSGQVVIVNENAARRWFGGQSAIGARVKLRDDKEWRTVVGMVGDTAYTFYNTVEWLNGPRIFVPFQQSGGQPLPVASHVYLLIRGRAVTLETLRPLLKSLDPGLRLGSLNSAGELVREVVRQPRLRTQLLGGLAGMSLLLAAIGIYGVMAQSVVQRTHEIGVRMALGARANDLVRMVVAQGLRLAMAGIVVGVVCALLLTRILASLLYGVKPTDVVTFAVAALVLLSAVVLAAVLPARSATRVDPMVALRQD